MLRNDQTHSICVGPNDERSFFLNSEVAESQIAAISVRQHSSAADVLKLLYKRQNWRILLKINGYSTKRALKAVLFGFLVVLLPLAASAQNMCGSQPCDTASRHDDTGGGSHYGLGGQFADCPVTVWVANALPALDVMLQDDARCNSKTGAYNFSFTGGSWLLPLDPSKVGGQWTSLPASFNLTATWKSDGSLYSSGQATTSNMIIGCSDANSVIGIDAACYCKTPYKWYEGAAEGVPVPDGCYQIVDEREDQSPPPHSCPLPDPDPAKGNPIFPVTGTKRLNEDVGITIGHERLSLRYDTIYKLPYVSFDGQTNRMTASYPVTNSSAGLGEAWSHSLFKPVETQTIAGNKYVVTFRVGNSWTSFVTSTYAPVMASTREKLTFDGTYYKLTLANGDVETYSFTQYLRTDYASGGFIAATYGLFNGTNRLLNVKDDQGRTLSFGYDGSSSLSSITAPDGSVINVQVTANGLSKVTWADGASRAYLYERDMLPNKLSWAVTGVVDENNSRLTTYTYDDDGYASGTTGPNGYLNYTVSYTQKPGWTVTARKVGNVIYRRHRYTVPTGISLTTPTGAVVSMTAAQTAFGAGLSSQSQPAGSGCAASTNNIVYDASGNVTQVDDFNGQRACYSYDTSNRETARVEGLPNTVACSTVLPTGTIPTGARKTTTSWHPDYRSAAVSQVPGVINTTVYQGQPDPFNSNIAANCTTAAALPNGKAVPLVCKQISQATKDISGVVTYDASFDNVVVLVHGDPQTGLKDSKTGTLINKGTISAVNNFGGGSYVSAVGATGTLTSPKGMNQLFKSSGADFTIEAYVRSSVATQTGALLSRCRNIPSSNFYGGIYLTYANSQLSAITMKVIANTQGSASFASTSDVFGFDTTSPAFVSSVLPANSFDHVAVTKSGQNYTFFLNGKMLGTITRTLLPIASTSASPENNLCIGYSYENNVTGAHLEELSAYIDELRITQGLLRYTADFTLPTTAFLESKVDSTVAAVTSSYTYDGAGRVLTATDTSNRTTNYAYYTDSVMDGQPVTGASVMTPVSRGHMVGDLQSITEPGGFVTTYDLYDPAGRVLQSTDPKGVVTDISYTPRGWIKTVSTTAPGQTARLTTYSYDAVGQMIGVASPDGTALTYTYDAAHRLTGVTDARGNTVTYTLDNMGNRTGEDIKDPSGTLQRSISRSFDALNRVQQVTGAPK